MCSLTPEQTRKLGTIFRKIIPEGIVHDGDKETSPDVENICQSVLISVGPVPNHSAISESHICSSTMSDIEGDTS